MKTQNVILLGVVGVAGVGYYFYNKSKAPMSNVNTTTVGEPNKTGFNREKASKELAVLIFSNMKKPIDKELIKPTTTLATSQATPQAFVGLTREEAILQAQRNVAIEQIRYKEQDTELSLYKKVLEGLTGITDDSDAEFIVDLFKKYFQAGGGGKLKPNLDAQIRIDKIQQKYPIALKKLDFGS